MKEKVLMVLAFRSKHWIPPREAPQSHYPIYLERLDTNEPSQQPPLNSHSVPTMVFNHHKLFVGIKLNKLCHRGKNPSLRSPTLHLPLYTAVKKHTCQVRTQRGIMSLEFQFKVFICTQIYDGSRQTTH